MADQPVGRTDSGADAQSIAREEQKPTTLALGGTDHHIGRRETGIATDQISQETIAFDFFVNVTTEIATEDKIRAALSQALDITGEQVTELKVVDAGNQHRSLVRVTGKVTTDEWEMRTLAGKFQRLIPDRILSGQLKEVLGLEDRPRVSRFYSRSSTTHLPGINTVSPYPHDKQPGTLKTTPSMRQAKPAEASTGLNPDQSSVREKPRDPDADSDAPSGGRGCGCLVM